MAGVLPVDRHMDDRTDAVAFNGFDAELFHQLGVARGDGVAVHHGGNAVAADLFDIGDAAAVDLLAVGLLKALADRVRRGALGKRGIFEKLRFFNRTVVHAGHFKHALRKRAGLIKHEILRVRESFEIV